MMKLVSLILSVSLIANVVGCCMRTFGGGETAVPPQSQSQSQSQSESESASSAPAAPESTPPESAPAVPQPAPESAAQPAPLPDTLTFDYLFDRMDADSVEIYSSESGKRITAEMETAKANIGKLGVDKLQKKTVDDPATPEETAYVSVAGGDITFYIYKGTDYGCLVTPEQSACYALPGNLYSRIQFAMMFL